jgi:hypothetical protein
MLAKPAVTRGAEPVSRRRKDAQLSMQPCHSAPCSPFPAVH